MSELAKDITPVSIEEELKTSYLDYAMSVIVGRALPDVRDGLKPVHRRVLFSMDQNNNVYNRAHVKSARVVGDVIGKYHPHGDSAVYDTIVRMAQPFSLRYMLVDGQGNFGSIDGDAPAAMRYTEVRMQKITQELLTDLDKETVDFSPNYDGKEMIPDVLPTKIPALLVNGSSGIAVGMATNIPPHNLNEVLDGCLAYIENDQITIEELMQHIPGPDFPTAAIINGRKGIEDAYRTGRGKIYVRAKASVETTAKGREQIIVTEIPYQVNKARLIEKIAELVKEKKIEGISELRDESEEDIRIVIELKTSAVGEVVLNTLYALTQMQVTFGINMVALDHGQPKVLNLKQIIEAFVTHRREVVTRRTIYELRKARERAHILEGYSVALENIDTIIELIRGSRTTEEALEKLLARGWSINQFAPILSLDARPDLLPAKFGVHNGEYFLSEAQAKAILELRLQRLTGLEYDKILDEYKEILVSIGGLLHILNSAERLMEVIREELELVKANFGDERRTEITSASGDINLEDLIAQEDVVVTLSHAGYVKYQPLSDYEAQRRGGKGKSATKMKEDDFIEKLLVANTHDTILCFSSRGRLYQLKVYQLPQASRGARGTPIVNILPLVKEENERITAILPIPNGEFSADKFIFMATASGVVKKVSLDAFANVRSSGLIALKLREGDELIGVDITDGESEIMLFSAQGRVVRFAEKAVRSMGRVATGVRGIKLATTELADDIEDAEIEPIENEEAEDTSSVNLTADKVVSLVIPHNEGDILTVTQNGFGKRTALSEYPIKSRATKGVVSIKTSERNGKVVAAVQVEETDQIMLITDAGTLVRTRVNEVALVGRNTQGVRIIRTAEDEQVVSLERICEIEEEDSEGVEASEE
ncbi:DNA gyrase subunit A [Pasteurellaceae bacterium 15-036681]|nr:DNA gyrase subunit A [Pasteurellaceae bacterium 15-036681]